MNNRLEYLVYCNRCGEIIDSGVIERTKVFRITITNMLKHEKEIHSSITCCSIYEKISD